MRTRIALVAASLLLLGGLAPLTSGAAAGAETSGTTGSQARRTDSGSSDAAVKDKHVVLEWSGRHGKKQKSVVVPDIGQLKLVCKPDNTMVKLIPFDRDAETQMWLAKHEVKGGDWSVAVKTVRIYRYATADDDGLGGTGKAAHEGLNQDTPVEDFSQGYMDGVISQRPGRNKAVGSGSSPISTSLSLTWWWERFQSSPKDGYCKIDLTTRTRYDQAIGVSWHGESDAAGRETQTTTIPGIGDLLLTCTPDDPADPDADGGTQTVALRTDDPDAYVEIERIEAEGREQDHIEEETDGYADNLGQTFPTPLPENGILRLWLHAHGQVEPLTLSSYFVVNDENPALNLCEVAAAEAGS